MNRVLVTGSTGFIGRHVLKPLAERGFDVHAVARTRPAGETAPPAITWHEADLFDTRATNALIAELEATHLLHLAWYTEHGKFWDAGENLDWVGASAQLLRRFRAHGGRRAVVAGTCAEYDWSGDCCGEETAVAPATLYGISKNALRQLLEGYGRSSRLSTAWGRVFFTHGPGEQPTRVIPTVARAVVAGEPVGCSAGSQIRDFLYVEDVATAFAALVDSTATGPFDIGSGRGTAVRDVLLRLEELAGRSGLVRLGAVPQPDEPARIVAEPRRLVSDVGWQPVHSFDDGLERTLSWWRAAATGD